MIVMVHGVTTGHLLEYLVQFGASCVFAITTIQIWCRMGAQIQKLMARFRLSDGWIMGYDAFQGTFGKPRSRHCT